MKRFLSTSLIVLALFVGTAGMYVPLAHADPPGAGTATPQNPPVSDSSSYGFIMGWIMTLFAWLLGVAAITLNNAVFYTVVRMGDYIHKLDAIGVAWRVLRDVGNIALIFGFLAVGITVILNADWYGGGKKLLPMLIIAAVALNFSLFASEAVIDVGNLVATQFYTQINGGNPATGSTNFAEEGISTAIMSKLGLATIYSDAKTNQKIFIAGNSWVIGFMGILLFLVAAFVMFSLAFILIARFVMLIFLIILSPVGIAGLAIPKLQSQAKEWWHKLFEQAMTAPVLLLLLYIALRVILDDAFLTGFRLSKNPNAWTDWINNGGSIESYGSLLLSFLIAMGLLLAVVMFAKKMSAFGASWATSMGGKLSFGATAFVARRTVGRVSNAAARKIRTTGFGRTETGRLVVGAFDRGAKGSFDIRGTSALKNIPGGNVDAGAAQKGGYRAREDQLIKDRTDYAKGLKQTPGEIKAGKEAEEEKKKIKTKHDENMQSLQTAEQAQLAATRALVDISLEEVRAKRQALEEARKSGGDVVKAERELTEQREAHKKLVKEEQEKLDPIRKNIAIEKLDYETKVLAQDTAIHESEVAPQKQYAQVLEKRTGVWKAAIPTYDWTTAVGSARREAAGKIFGEAKKDKSAKLADRLDALLAKEDKAGGGTAPSAPSAPATPPTT